MHTFSLENIRNGIKKTVNRFPIPMIIAFALTVVGLILVDVQLEYLFQQTEFTLGLALLLTVAAKLYTETHPGKRAEILSYGLTLVLVVAFFFWGAPRLSDNSLVTFEYVMQYILWLLAGFLAIGFAPTIRKTYSEFDFWKYIARLGGGLIAAIAYSVVLFGGLAIAFGTVSYLFGLDFEVETFLRLWIVITGLVAPTLFLNHIPNLDEIAKEQGAGYPVGLRHLTNYILVPLVCVYFAILYVYSAQILLTMTWPKGIISVMILGFSGLGLLVYMILYPIIKTTPSFSKAAKVFFIILLPQIAMLFYAVAIRINEYAWTPQRYMIVAGGIWLLLVSLYVLISKIKNLKFFFTTLFVFVVLSSFGPWGMFNVSATSQVNRLEDILSKNNLLENGQIQKVTSPDSMSFEDKREISAIAIYLYQTHALDRVQPWTQETLSSDTALTRAVGIEMTYYYNRPGENQTIYTDFNEKLAETITGYDYSIRDLFGTYTLDGSSYEFSQNIETGVYTILKNDLVIATFSITPFIEQMKSDSITLGRTTLPAKNMTRVFENDKIKIKMMVNSLYTWGTEKNMNGSLLIKIK